MVITEEVLQPARLSVVFGGDEESVEEDDDDHEPEERPAFHNPTNRVSSISQTIDQSIYRLYK